MFLKVWLYSVRTIGIINGFFWKVHTTAKQYVSDLYLIQVPYWSVDVLSSLPNQLVFSNDALKVKTLLSIKSALEMTKPKKFTPLRGDMFPIVCRYPIQVVIPFMWRRIFPSSVSYFFPYFLPSKVIIYKSRGEVQSISFARENIKKTCPQK